MQSLQRIVYILSKQYLYFSWEGQDNMYANDSSVKYPGSETCASEDI